jgi:CHASE3 domain sensor protein
MGGVGDIDGCIVTGIRRLAVGLAIVAAWYIQDMQERASGPIARSVASMIAAQELEISTREVSAQCNLYLITRDEKYLEKVTPLKRRITAALANAEAGSITPASYELIRIVRKGCYDFYSECDKLLHNPSPEAMAAILSFAVIYEYD